MSNLYQNQMDAKRWFQSKNVSLTCIGNHKLLPGETGGIM